MPVGVTSNVNTKQGPGHLIHPQYLYSQSKFGFAKRCPETTPDSLQSLEHMPEGIVQNLSFSAWAVFLDLSVLCCHTYHACNCTQQGWLN